MHVYIPHCRVVLTQFDYPINIQTVIETLVNVSKINVMGEYYANKIIQ